MLRVNTADGANNDDYLAIREEETVMDARIRRWKTRRNFWNAPSSSSTIATSKISLGCCGD